MNRRSFLKNAGFAGAAPPRRPRLPHRPLLRAIRRGHGHDLARNFPGLGVGAQRLADRITAALRRPPDHPGLFGRRTRAAAAVARCGHWGSAEMSHGARLLLAEQEPGPELLHRRAVRHDLARAHRLGPLSRRPGSVGRDLRPVRRAGLPVGRHRHPGGRLVPQRADRRLRHPGPALPHARPRRPGLGEARRFRHQHGGRRDFPGAPVGHARRGRVRRPLQ